MSSVAWFMIGFCAGVAAAVVVFVGSILLVDVYEFRSIGDV